MYIPVYVSFPPLPQTEHSKQPLGISVPGCSFPNLSSFRRSEPLQVFWGLITSPCEIYWEFGGTKL